MTWDKNIKGLHTVTSSTGVKSYHLFYRTKSGKQRRFKLADARVFTLADAREAAKKMLAQVALGGDPYGEMRAGKNDKTVEEVFRELEKSHYERAQFARSGWAKQVTSLWNTNLQKAFGDCKVSKVTPSMVMEWHMRLETTPYSGNRAKSVLSKLFRFAELKGYVPQGFNPCRSVPNHKEKKRKRFATETEIQRVREILERDADEYPKATLFISLLMATASRPSGIERLDWRNLCRITLDGQAYGVVTIQGKSGEEEIVLPPKALKLCDERRTFETSIAGKFPRSYWAKIRREVGCLDLWARDWRRTGATLGLSGGITLGTLQELLNHKDASTTSIYAKLTRDAKLRASGAIEVELERQGA